VDSIDNDGRSALWHAVNRRYFWHRVEDVVSLLLASGKVDPSAKDKDGISPLSLAESMRLQLAAGVDPTHSDLTAWTKVIERMRLYLKKAKVNEVEVCAHLIDYILNTDKTQVLATDYQAEDEVSSKIVERLSPTLEDSTAAFNVEE
jgi:hypothetical protein